MGLGVSTAFSLLELLAKLIAFLGTPAKLEVECSVAVPLELKLPVEILLDLEVHCALLNCIMLLLGEDRLQCFDNACRAMHLGAALSEGMHDATSQFINTLAVC